mmetsp:Transcript_12377/g.37758  ORF Transcript_12377/g.37758 Transcript_12377/m.37758 type:complete len:292 (+) Transcript_12377:246-1121(+)
MIIPTGSLFQKNKPKGSPPPAGIRNATQKQSRPTTGGHSPSLRQSFSLTDAQGRTHNALAQENSEKSTASDSPGPSSSAARPDDLDYSQYLSQRTNATYKNLLSLRHQSQTPKARTSDAAASAVKKASALRERRGLHEKGQLQGAIAALMGNKGRHIEVVHALQKSRRKAPALGAPKISPGHYNIMKTWLAQRRKEQKIEFTEQQLEEELLRLMFKMRDTKVSTLDREKFYALDEKMQDTERSTDARTMSFMDRDGRSRDTFDLPMLMEPQIKIIDRTRRMQNVRKLDSDV